MRGQFEDFEGGGHLDGDDPSKSRVTLTIRAGSILTHNPRRDDMLRGKFLNADDHPSITFTSTGAEQVDETTFRLAGDLTIGGVTKPISVAFEWTGAERDSRGNVRIRFQGSATINRKDWGVNWSGAAGLVAKTVALEFDVAAVRRT